MIGSGNWIIDNLNSALAMWNERLLEIWQLITTSPESFKGGGIWSVIVNINDGLKAVGYALLVLFFVMGVIKICGSFAEMKKPEMAFKCFIRFVLAQAAVSWGMELMTGAFRVAQGMVTTIIDSSGLTAMSATALPDEMVSIIEDVGFIDSIPLWAVTLLGSLFIWVLSLVMILTVYMPSALDAIEYEVGNGVAIQESVAAAIAIFMAAHGDVEKTILGGANIGGDTDTIACMAGMLAGAYRGAASIRLDWRKLFKRQIPRWTSRQSPVI